MSLRMRIEKDIKPYLTSDKLIEQVNEKQVAVIYFPRDNVFTIVGTKYPKYIKELKSAVATVYPTAKYVNTTK